MPPVYVTTGITDSKWVELVSENPARPVIPEKFRRNTDNEIKRDKPKNILRDDTELVINAKAGTKNKTSGGLFGGGGRRGPGPR